jgi:hypothetical protein
MPPSSLRSAHCAVALAGMQTARVFDATQARPLVRQFQRGLWALGACLLTLVGPEWVAGQDSAFVVPGARVRYWLREMSKPVEAVLVSRIADRIRVRPLQPGDTLEFALSALSRLEVRRGPELQGETGAALGLFGGAIVGSFRFEHGGSSPGTYQGDVLRAYVFAVLCAASGWLIGSRVHRYRWQSVPLGAGIEPRVERLSLDVPGRGAPASPH